MRSSTNKFLQRYAMAVCLVVLIILLQLFNLRVPLFSLLNIKNILLQSVSIALAALGLSFIMMSGEGDISFAGMFSLMTVIFALIANKTDSFMIAFMITLSTGLAVNMGISLLVTRWKLSSFIVSITIMFMANGVEKAMHQRTTLITSGVIRSFAVIEFALPLVVWLMLVAYAASFIVINRTVFGFNLRIVGENRAAGIEAGINCGRMKIYAYLIAAVMLVLAATVETTRVGAIYEQGKHYMLPIFTACFLGSSMFVPGRINIFGTFVGALFMGIIINFMRMMNVESFIIPIVQGGILIIAVALASFRNRTTIQQVKLGAL